MLIRVVFGTLFLVMLTTGAKAENGFNVLCEPTEISDIGRVVRAHIYDSLKGDKTIKEKIISVKVKTIDKRHTTKALSELLIGSGINFDPNALTLSLNGDIAGHACFATASVTVDLKIKRKNGTVDERQFVSTISIPGAYATKAKVAIVPQ